LARPFHLACLQIERDHGVAGLLLRITVAISSGHINQAALGIDRRRAPDAGSGWSPKLRARRSLSAPLRRFRDRVSLPNNFAGRSIQRGDASAERAALVIGTRGRRFLAHTGCRYI
jgi:hypothetical protein